MLRLNLACRWRAARTGSACSPVTCRASRTAAGSTDDVVDIATAGPRGRRADRQAGRRARRRRQGGRQRQPRSATQFPYLALPQRRRRPQPGRRRPARGRGRDQRQQLRRCAGLRRLGCRDHRDRRCSRRPRGSSWMNRPPGPVAGRWAGRGGLRRSGGDAVPPPPRRGPGEPGRVHPRRLDGDPLIMASTAHLDHRAVPTGSPAAGGRACGAATGGRDRGRPGRQQPRHAGRGLLNRCRTGSPPPSRRRRSGCGGCPATPEPGRRWARPTWSRPGSAPTPPTTHRRRAPCTGRRSCSPRATPPPPSDWARWPTPGTTSPPPAATPSRRWRATRPAWRRTGCSPTRPPSSATRDRHRGRATHAGPAPWPGRVHPGLLRLELHGRVDEARVALERALGAATSRDDLAFCQYHLGELAWRRRRPGGRARPLRARTRRRRRATCRCSHGRAKVAAAARPGRRGDHRVRTG